MHVPVWHREMRSWVEREEVVLVGITQEQHAERCRLFSQWQEFDWPILHDPINLMQTTAVPIVVAIDEHGTVRGVKPKRGWVTEEFLETDYPAPQATAGGGGKVERPIPPDLDQLQQRAAKQDDAESWLGLADALTLWGGSERVAEAMEAYRRVLAMEPEHADALFRLGVCFRKRYDSSQREPGDFQDAVDYWSMALAKDPNQYIWRRRIQQYGPRLAKPYPFYDWVNRATTDIRARGEDPVPLEVPLTGAEIARPSRQSTSDRAGTVSESAQQPDPRGEIHRDDQGLIAVEVAVVPPRIQPGQAARVHVTFRPDVERQAKWNNENEPLQLWVDPPPGWEAEGKLFAAPQGKEVETTEARSLDFELRVPKAAKRSLLVEAYALYYVCEHADGQCLYLRRDIRIPIEISP